MFFCLKISYEWFHNKFDASCQSCRQDYCKECKKFMISFEMILDNTDEIGKQYLKDFISDFLNVSLASLENYFPTTTRETIRNEKKLFIKSYKKSEKNRDQEIKNPQKINYTFKGKQRSFYMKF